MSISHYLFATSIFLSGTAFCGDSPRTIHAAGEGMVQLPATIAEVSVGIEVSERTAEDANQELARRQNDVLRSLRSRGVSQIETKWFSLNPRYSSDDRLTIIGYNASTTISFVTTTEDAGEMLESALNSGANKNQGIQLRPRPEEIAQAEKRAIQLAGENAMDRIQASLDGLGLSFEKILRVNLAPGSVGYQPVQRYAMMAEAKLETSNEAFEVRRSVEITAEID